MSLRTLKEVKEIGGFKVGAGEYVQIEGNTISFTIQTAPIQEVGVNGCQVDTLIEAARLMLQGLNEEVECVETQMAASYLGSALRWLGKRKKDRIRRGVEGTRQK